MLEAPVEVVVNDVPDVLQCHYNCTNWCLHLWEIVEVIEPRRSDPEEGNSETEGEYRPEEEGPVMEPPSSPT